MTAPLLRSQLLRIVPPPFEGNRPVPTHGTRVLTEDGTEIHGITRIVLIAEVGCVWRATIDCMVIPEDVYALAEVTTHSPYDEVPDSEASQASSWWQRFKQASWWHRFKQSAQTFIRRTRAFVRL